MLYPDSGLDHNYCRNPNGRAQIWCYTSVSSSEWEYCSGIDSCSKMLNEDQLVEVLKLKTYNSRNENQWKQYFYSFDVDQDQVLSYEEFKNLTLFELKHQDQISAQRMLAETTENAKET